MEAGEFNATPNPFLEIVENPEGSIRRPEIASSPPSGEGHVISKDVVLNSANATWLRLYLPRTTSPPTSDIKDSHILPIILFFHGGRFVIFSAATVFFHRFCEQMAAAVPAMVVSVNYRLAPEHRLPAAYDDGAEALLWLKKAAEEDPWLNKYGDLRHLFLMGSSSGANIAYHLAIKSATSPEVLPLTITGAVLNQLYLGGRHMNNSGEIIWRLALPEGATWDHEYRDVTAALRRRRGKEALKGMPRCLVVGYRGDPLFDLQKELADELDGAGVEVVARLDDEGFHGIELSVPEAAEKLFDEIRSFVAR